MIKPHLVLRLLALMTAAGSPLLAQTAAPAPAAADEVVTLDALEVSEVPIEQNIMPTSRPFSSVYGDSRTVMETPRNVTIISREQLDRIGILEVRDFSKLTASSYTQTNFGLPSNPSIRGQTADVLVNGMRRGLTVNGNGMPVNFNSVESINIVKGSASTLYGASSYSGGYADFITKKPYFDSARGYISGTVGSYDIYRWTADYGAPISDKLAYRVSYSGEDSVGYYYYGKKKTQAVYGALEWRPNEKYTLEANAEFYVADVTENWGINRVTQDLIDNGLYIPDAGSDAAYAASLGSVGGFANPVRPYGTPIKIDRRTRLLAPGDDSFGTNVTTQVIQTVNISTEARLLNNTFFNYINRDTFSSYYYNSVHRDNWGIENRLQYENKFELGSTENKYTAGFGLRHQQVWAVDDYYHEPVNSFDLTRNANLNRVPASAFGGFNASVLIPGYGPRGILPGRYGTPGASYSPTPVFGPGFVLQGFTDVNGNLVPNQYVTGSSSNDSKLSQVSPFYQHEIKFNDQLSILGGARADFAYVENTDPLPPPGYTPASDSISVVMPSYNVSPIYKITPKLTGYYTYSFTTSAYGGLGGGYPFMNGADYGGNGRQFYDWQFEQENYLHEIGLKKSYLNNTLFIGTALFDQRQEWLTGDGKDRYIKSRGFEIEGNYQPSRRFFATASYSYFDSRQRFTGFLADSIPYDQRIGGPVAAITPDFPSISDEFQQPGIPEHLLNFLVNYKFESGFGVTLGTVITGPIITSQEGRGVTALGQPVTLKANEIPWQYTLDLTLSYAWRNWDTRFIIRNITDEENWSAPNPGYGNGSINAELPINFELTVGYKF